MGRPRTIEVQKVMFMRVLALNGPATNRSLAGRVKCKKKKGLTDLALSTVNKYIRFLSKVGYIETFGHQEIPERKRGRPPEPPAKRPKALLYGLSWRGLEFIFMEDAEVREKWDIVSSYYADAERNVWFGLAIDWMSNPKLKAFPLMRKYNGSEIRHYKPGPRLFIQSIIFSVNQKEDKFKEALEEAAKIIQKYGNRKVTFYLQKELKDEMERCSIVLDKCKRLQPILESLREKEPKTLARKIRRKATIS